MLADFDESKSMSKMDRKGDSRMRRFSGDSRSMYRTSDPITPSDSENSGEMSTKRSLARETATFSRFGSSRNCVE